MYLFIYVQIHKSNGQLPWLHKHKDVRAPPGKNYYCHYYYYYYYYYENGDDSSNSNNNNNNNNNIKAYVKT
jgi:hypothetical protein